MTTERKNNLINSLPNDDRDAYKQIAKLINEVEKRHEAGELTSEQMNNFYCLIERELGLQ